MTPIKIVYVIGSLEAGGAERQLLELLKNLDRRRFEASLVLSDCSTAHQANGLVKEVYDLRIPSKSNSRWRLRTAKFSRAVLNLSSYFKRTRPTIVQAILPTSNILAAAAGALWTIPVLIGSRRSLVGAYRTTKCLSIVDRTAARRCDLMLGNSAAVVRELIEVDGLSASTVIRIPNGVDTRKFHPGNREERSRYGWTDEHIVFGIVANFIPYKRHIDFVLAAERISTSNPNARFLMAGEDRRGILESLKAEIRVRRLESLFTIIPGTSEPEHLYPAMDVYISTSDTEGLSNVLLEAGASGLPIVATRVGGNPEIVVDGHNGFLIEPRAPESVAAAATLLAENPRMRSQMGAQSRERVVAEFSIRAMVDAHEELYEHFVLNTSFPMAKRVRATGAWTYDR